jgi:hypothetical protein
MSAAATQPTMDSGWACAEPPEASERDGQWPPSDPKLLSYSLSHYFKGDRS